MKNIINTIKEFIGLDTILISVALAFIFGIMFAGISAQNEVSYTDTEETFRTECYEKFEKAMDYIYTEDYSEYNVKMAKIIANNSFLEKLNQNEELVSNIWFPTTYVDNMVEEFTTRYQSMVKKEPKSKISQIMDELEKEFSQDYIVEREGNSMWIEPIEDKPILEQELVSIKDVDKPILEQNLVSIKDINE
jgi:hypothetical protein